MRATSSPLRRVWVALSTALVAGGLCIAAMAAPASADPVNAPGASIGVADCGSAGLFSFVVNSGVGSGNGGAWNPALAVSETDSNVVFVPTELHLVFTTPNGPFSVDRTKGVTQGSVQCTVSAQGVNLPISFVGTAIGNIVTRGHG